MAARKSQLFLHSILPVTKSHDEVIRSKLKPGKFVITPAGLVKVFGLICILVGLSFFLSSSMCSDKEVWHILLLSISNAMVLIIGLGLYLIFSLGLTTKKPWFWVKSDVAINIFLPLLSIVLSIVATSSCSHSNQLHSITLPIVIVGNALMLVSAGALFLLYRYKEDEFNTEPEIQRAPPPSRGRKSIFA